MILFGTAWFIYFSFDTKTSNQDKLLEEIAESQRIGKSNNSELVAIKDEVTKLKESNEQLVQSVCILQDQIKSLGAVPVINRDPICDQIIL